MLLFAFVGLVLSFYAFFHNRGFVSVTLCDLNAKINCDIVNKGPYSVIAGIPVSLLGIIGYFFLIVATWLKRKNPEDKSLTRFLLFSSLGALLFTLYLSALEAFVIQAWCLICVTSQLMMLFFTYCSFRIFIFERKQKLLV